MNALQRREHGLCARMRFLKLSLSVFQIRQTDTLRIIAPEFGGIACPAVIQIHEAHALTRNLLMKIHQ
ncbi:hypothetical protein PSP6_200123 [Paraburkholderia tropica]|nr:hypothetical protein PSP6_200123 [Paraburkholderia tropica]